MTTAQGNSTPPDARKIVVRSLEEVLAVDDSEPASQHGQSRQYVLDPDHYGGQGSWAPVDLGAVLVGDVTPLEPTQLRRDDGAMMLYPGRMHDFHGPPESLKSLLAQLAVAQVLLNGGHALYVDHESEARDVVGHLLAFNVPEEVIIARFTYVRPEQPLAEGTTFWLTKRPDISVIDGVDAAMALQGLDPNKAGEYRRWVELEARPLQRATTGPTVTIDHVVKNKEARGDWAGGTSAKLAAIDGASFGFEIVQHFGRGRVGVVRINLAKDRPGALRGHQGAGREIAKLRLTSHHPDDDAITWELLPPPAADGDADGAVRWRPTGFMQRVSKLLESAAVAMTQNDIGRAVPGKAIYVRQAVAELVEEGYAEVVPGERGSRLHRSIKPFRENPEPPAPTVSPPRPDRVPADGDTVPRPASNPSRGDADGTRSQGALLDADRVPAGHSQHIEAISQ